MRIRPSIKEQDRIDMLQPYIRKGNGFIKNRHYERFYGPINGKQSWRVGEVVEDHMKEAELRSLYNPNKAKRRFYL